MAQASTDNASLCHTQWKGIFSYLLPLKLSWQLKLRNISSNQTFTKSYLESWKCGWLKGKRILDRIS